MLQPLTTTKSVESKPAQHVATKEIERGSGCPGGDRGARPRRRSLRVLLHQPAVPCARRGSSRKVVKGQGPSGTMKSRADRIKSVVKIENKAWDRATERRADAEYALEQFVESKEWEEMPDDERAKRHEVMSAVINKARQEEMAAERAWRKAMERAERKIPR